MARKHGSHTFPLGPFADLMDHYRSVPDLAAALGVSVRALQDWAYARVRPRHQKVRQRVEDLCERLGVEPPDWTAQATAWRRRS